MCLSAFPQHSKVQIIKRNLDQGTSSLEVKHVRPSERTLLCLSEQNAWKDVHHRDAAEEEHLFWSREVCERTPRKEEKGGGKTVAKTWTEQGKSKKPPQTPCCWNIGGTGSVTTRRARNRRIRAGQTSGAHAAELEENGALTEMAGLEVESRQHVGGSAPTDPSGDTLPSPPAHTTTWDSRLAV